MNDWRDARRILCVRLDNLGDVLMTTPAIRALKRPVADGDGGAHPRHVTLLCSTAGREIARHVPEIDGTIAHDAPWVAVGRSTPLQSDIVARLAAGRFDAAVIFTCYTQSALPAAMLCGQAGIPLRLAHCRENPYGLLTDWVRDPEPHGGIRHEVERQLALVATIGATTSDDRLSIGVSASAKERFAAVARARGIAVDRPYIVLHPGASAPSRRWPADRFGATAAALLRSTNLPVLVTGTASETELAATLVHAASGVDGPRGQAALHDLTGALALDELIAAIDGARLVISNNSGPAHIAAACGTPVVDLYALTNPQHTPWRVASRVLSHDVPCRNCQRSVCPERHHACLTGVTVEETVAAATGLLEETAASSFSSTSLRERPLAARAHRIEAITPC